MFATALKFFKPQPQEYEETIDPAWFSQVLESLQYTPDAGDLFQQEYHLLFVYNGLKKNGDTHWMIQEKALLNADTGQPVRWRAYTRDNFSVWVKDERYRKFPVALPPTDEDHPMWSAMKRGGLNRSPPGKLKGELYLVPPQVILWLDKQYRNGVEFSRQNLTLYIPTRRVHWVRDPSQNPMNPPQISSIVTSDFHLNIVKAKAYVGHPDYWGDLIDAGFNFSPCNLYKPKRDLSWLNRYYNF